MIRKTCLRMLLAAWFIQPGLSLASDTIELPLTRAVLYASGVGYFEHSRTIDGDVTVRLMFKTAQINDVLKSLVVNDFDGGTVQFVSYPANEPLGRTLSGFAVDIGANPTLADLLTQLRGARATVSVPEKISGQILGVEKRTKLVGSGAGAVTVPDEILNLATEAGIRPIPMSSVQSVQLVDPGLQEELGKALTLLGVSRDRDAKPVDLLFTGLGKRRVRIGYLVEVPVWKTTYRLDLSSEKPLLQGWAIVENTSDTDWKGVKLSLVSGQPVSFIQDLYTPLYLSRPEVKPELFAGLTPRRHEAGMAMAIQEQVARRAERRAAAAPRAMPKMATAGPGYAGGPAPEGEMVEEAMPVGSQFDQGVVATTQATRMAELFSFALGSPVDLARRRAAMLPIVNQPVTAEKVSIYNRQTLARHPLNAVLLTNGTGYKLLGGPVTVFDGGAYAGDAQIDHLPANGRRLLSYAVDLEVTVDPTENTTSTLSAIKIVKGAMQLIHKRQSTQVYTLASTTDSTRNLVIEHPFRPAWKLVEPLAYAEKTPEAYRFRAQLAGGESGTFTVREELVETQSLALLDYDLDSLVYMVRSETIGPKVREALQKAIAKKQELRDLELRLDERRRQLSDLQAGQERLRDNIKTLGSDSVLAKRYIAKLDQEENQIDQLEKQIALGQEEIVDKRAELAGQLQKLSVE